MVKPFSLAALTALPLLSALVLPCPLASAATDISLDTSTAQGAALARTEAERQSTFMEPQDFLNASQGQTTAGLVQGQVDVGPIINTMLGQGVRSIYLPCGFYKLATTINLPSYAKLQGAGACTVLSLQSSTGDGIAGRNVSFTSLRDFTMEADVVKQSGAAIAYYNAFETGIENIPFTNGLVNNVQGLHYDNIYLEGANSTHISHVSGRGASHNGITATGRSKRAEDTYVTSSGFDSYGRAPLELIWASGVYLSSLDLLHGQAAGILVDPDISKSQEVDGLRATAVLGDSNIGPGWLLGGSGPITEFNITNCWGSTNGFKPGTMDSAGLAPAQGFALTNPAANGVTVASSEFHANTGAGIDIEQGTHIIVNGNAVYMNAYNNPKRFPGIYVGNLPDMVTVTNNQSGAGGEAQNIQGGTRTSLQSYGIQSSVQPDGHVAQFEGNMGTGNQLGAFNIPTGGSLIVLGNGGN
ncbi:hypothetical protein E3E12_07320 [Formicincola oecophyllae]|uniref:Pectate lyase superfamily protein domain-containing protein n=1 Tax=Formicincola oecophyllae TaxID=2558361 RepID=A0A4Y6UBS1_9PROT|nr:hypothetical protein [Formicincola oecophyllae]QDH14018.1 hypothetical protein E3E12_07320 [Formicincola oecophyllae]